MRRLLALVLAAFVALPLAAANANEGATNDYIVVLNDSTDDPADVARDHARSENASVSHLYRYAIRGYSASMSDSAAMRIARDPRVRLVQLDQKVEALGHTVPTPTGVHRSHAPHNSSIDIDGQDDARVDVDVAVVDTGIDLDHPDLNVVGGKNCSSGSSYDDGNGHGTHVAGTVGGLDAGHIPGMAPGARLWAVRVLDNNGSGSWSNVICGVDWVTANRSTIEVANMSLGGTGTEPSDPDFDCITSSALHDAICRSVLGGGTPTTPNGVTYAIAAGNSAADSKGYVPAAYNEVITVSALADFDGLPGGLGGATCRSDVDETMANFSNYGEDVDIIAPGVCIRSSWRGGGYNTISGTSMASPHVAGAAALYESARSNAGPLQVKSALTSNGNTGWNKGTEDKDNVKEPLLDVGSDATKASVFAPALIFTTPPAANESPTATPTSATLSEDTLADISVAGSDKETCELTFAIVSGPSHGSAAITNSACVNGTPNTDSATVRYTPTANYNGTDSFTYRVTDGSGASADATVGLTITPVDDPLTASFRSSCSALTCGFTDTTSGDSTAVAWAWDFGVSGTTDDTSTAQNPSYTYPASGTYNVSLTVTDSTGATSTTSADVTVSLTVGPSGLTATAVKNKGSKSVTLNWSPGTESAVDIYRNGALIVWGTANDGGHSDILNRGGTFTYEVCVAGTRNCSNSATASF